MDGLVSWQVGNRIQTSWNLPATKALCNLDQEFGIHRYLSINIVICICLSMLRIKSFYPYHFIYLFLLLFLAIHPYYIYVSQYLYILFINSVISMIVLHRFLLVYNVSCCHSIYLSIYISIVISIYLDTILVST